MKIAIVGTGYVGLVTGTCFAETGHDVICVDIDAEKLRKLKSGTVTIYEPGLEVLFQRNIAHKRLTFTGDLKQAALASEIIFLCLPTPQGENGSADLQYVMGVAEDLGGIFSASGNAEYKIVVNKSTVPVGTVRKVAEVLKNRKANNVDVVSNPEFLREGFAVDDFMKPDRIVIGSDSAQATEKMKSLYEPFVRQGNPIFVMDVASAEVTKYVANSYLAMRITYMNEVANFCEKVGADVDSVRIGISADQRIGKRFLFPGIGYGGSCFPKDVKALVTTSGEAGSPIQLLTVVDKVNEAQKLRLVGKVQEHFHGNLKGLQFAVWGLAFKPNTDDIRESPSIVIIRELLKQGARVAAYDPAAITTARTVLGSQVSYAKDEYDALKSADALIIATEWNEFRNPDFAKIKGLMKSPVIFDGRNIFRPEVVQKLGFKYHSIGRRTL
ncbi:MAG TPA: UDP-glucose/GDP-mannose dehydrogenase family protein [Bacteroidota bacterium]|nr:UDP-glucose/GDP-mannose dehydrogenase family protein [Bacteroidota bacterium]